MKITITKTLEFEEFSQNFKTFDQVEAIYKLERRIMCYENKYNMLSKNFYKKYIKGDIEDSNDFFAWADKIETYSQLIGKRPDNIKVGDHF